MTSTETPRTSSIDAKLEGRHNYHSWFQQLRLELCATDPLYWPTIMGVKEGPVEPKYQCYTHEQAISAIARSKRIAHLQVTNQEVQRFFNSLMEQNKLLSHKYDAELEEWEQLNYRLRLKFCSTLDKVPASHIEHFYGARSAFVVIEGLYGGLYYPINALGVAELGDHSVQRRRPDGNVSLLL
ncbi:hypothetical protein PENNAL_c0023G03850 [Penicillium nalgiovense]|uniref:Uncharacterized protein n=1 Tax=Penicillium nalgiovense TaxID=60175 RepID=A0A1V6YEY7_PENNA|nr:hypothetical protein PENNAL_c0023G03850 [Penicillium nalgiovense]